VSTSSSRRQQQRRPRRLAPLKPTTDLDVIEAGAPVLLEMPHVPRPLLVFAAAVLGFALLVPPVREGFERRAFQRIEETWHVATAALEARTARVSALPGGLSGDGREAAVGRILEATAVRLDDLVHHRGGWAVRLDGDLRRLDEALHAALTLEVERLRSAAASAGDCCGTSIDAKRRIDVMLAELGPRYD
jgi:hypothetical protein